MDAEGLLELRTKYLENKDFITNEETAKMALIVPFIRLLGYDPNMPREVRLEFRADFTQGDGKKYPDRMDYAIFDALGEKPLLVIEAKPLGTDLKGSSQQLARYIAQMPELHFGIITDGAHYLFFGDLETNNVMDNEPFFAFSLDDEKSDWAKIATFLNKFSRETFNADTLITSAENSRYRQAMIDKLAVALNSPHTDDGFMNWLTADIYKGKRTAKVRARLARVVKDAIEPAILKVVSDNFLESLKERIAGVRDGKQDSVESVDVEANETPSNEELAGGGVVTTEEELELHRLAQEICNRQGYDPASVLYRDTRSYFNVSYKKPTKWFLRYYGDQKRKFIATRVPHEAAAALTPGFEVESYHSGSRIFLEETAQLWALQDLIVRSLEILVGDKEASGADHTGPT